MLGADTHAIQGVRRDPATNHRIADRAYDLELATVRARDANLRCAECARQRRTTLRQSRSATQRAQQPNRSVERVVIPGMLVSEEDVAGKLAGEERFPSPHAGPHMRMAGRPEPRPPSEFRDMTKYGFAGLDVCQQGGSRRIGQDVRGEDTEQMVRRHDLSCAVHDAKPVPIPVEGNAQVETVGPYCRRELRQVLGFRGVRMVRREPAVDSAVQDVMLAGKASRKVLEERAGRTVPRIPCNPERASLAGEPIRKGRGVRRPDTEVFHHAWPRVARERRRMGQLLDRLTEERCPAERELETVVLRRIVRSGNHYGPVGGQTMVGEMHHGRRADPDPYHVSAGFTESLDECALERGRGQPAITTHHDSARRALSRYPDCECLAERPCVGAPQGLADDSANVVGPQDRRIKPAPRAASLALHGPAARRQVDRPVAPGPAIERAST